MAQETLLNNRYRLLAQQGAGGMAVIYKAQDTVLGRVVAVKILRPSLTSNTELLTRFREEARSVANLMHPNVVTVHDVGQDRNTHYIVMEYVQGQDLKRIIREHAPLPIDRALNLAIQICAGVGYAHRAGFVHADVKPQNVLVTDDGIVKVTDFGIARAFSYSSTGDRQAIVWGSPHYFSPEQAQGEPPTPAADVYAIGVVLFEMLTGELPFKGKDHKELALAHIRDEPPLVSDINPNVPRNLSRIVRKVLAKEPSARYRTADQLGRILISYREQGQQTTDSLTPPREALPQTPRAQPRPTGPHPRAEAPPQATGTVPSARAEAKPGQQTRTQPAQAAPADLSWEYGEPAGAVEWPYQPSTGRAPWWPATQAQTDWPTLILSIFVVLSALGLIPVWAYVYHLYVVLR